MKHTMILISALALALMISSPVFAETISSATNGDNDFGTTTGFIMDGIMLSPNVSIEYLFSTDFEDFAMASWNTKGNREFACQSQETTIYYLDIDVDDGDVSMPAPTATGIITSATEPPDWSELGGS